MDVICVGNSGRQPSPGVFSCHAAQVSPMATLSILPSLSIQASYGYGEGLDSTFFTWTYKLSYAPARIKNN